MRFLALFLLTIITARAQVITAARLVVEVPTRPMSRVLVRIDLPDTLTAPFAGRGANAFLVSFDETTPVRMVVYPSSAVRAAGFRSWYFARPGPLLEGIAAHSQTMFQWGLMLGFRYVYTRDPYPQ